MSIEQQSHTKTKARLTRQGGAGRVSDPTQAQISRGRLWPSAMPAASGLGEGWTATRSRGLGCRRESKIAMLGRGQKHGLAVPQSSDGWHRSSMRHWREQTRSATAIAHWSVSQRAADLADLATAAAGEGQIRGCSAPLAIAAVMARVLAASALARASAASSTIRLRSFDGDARRPE